MNNSLKIDLTALANQLMLENGFIPGYPERVRKEIEAIFPPIIPQHHEMSNDYRHLLFFSMDNDDSRDLDQLTYAEKLPNGEYKIYIAVADVDLLVKKQTAIDARAAQNTTSVYTPTKIFPMLPEELSTDLTSLNPGEDRHSIVFEGVINSLGELKTYEIKPAYVHNHAQLAYDSVSNWLEGNGPIPEQITVIPGLEQQTRLQDDISKILDEYRHRGGALSLQTIEPKPVLENDKPVAITTMPKNRGRTLIENFMIIANTISARFSRDQKIPSLRRVVIVPRRWDKIMEVAAKYGTHLPEEPNQVALEKFLVDRKKADPDTFPDLSLTIIKLLGNGEYQIAFPGETAPGHFGLALKDYSHSTAPNRRYPDLITQRLLLATLRQQPLPYSNKELKDLALRCTQKEDEAEKIERHMRKSASAMVLSESIGSVYDAIVTGASDKGTWVRVFDPPVEGKLVRGFENLDVGDKVRVRLLATDVRMGFIDFGKEEG